MCMEEVEDAPNMVTGTFSIQTKPINVLFDSDATHSFIFVKVFEILGLVLIRRPPSTVCDSP